MPPLPSPRDTLLLLVAALAAVGLARVLRRLRPLWPLARRFPSLAVRGARHLGASAWAWSILPVRLQLVWPVTLVTVATSPYTSRMWRSVPWPDPRIPASPLVPAASAVGELARAHPWAAAPVAALAAIGLVHSARIVGRGAVARTVWRGLSAAWRWSDRLTRRILRVRVTLPLAVLLALVLLAGAELPALARVAPGGVIGVGGLLVWYAGYAAYTARKGRRPRWDGTVRVDDVSRLSEAAVDRVVHVLDRDDVVRVIREARAAGKAVSVRGKSHTMGGQTIAAGGVVIDTRLLRDVRWDPDERLVIAEAGATWGDVIRALNPHGLAPMTMQSYCSFSVGGTLAANAHGITNDLALVASVARIEVVDAEGRVRICDRERDAEWFRHVIGGYGLFGVLVRAWLRAVDNTKLAMSSTPLSPAAFPAAYLPLLDDPTIEVKLARVDGTTFDQVHLYVFRRAAPQATVSDLDATERQMSVPSRVLYTWAAPLPAVRRLRYAVEDLLQRPLDWSEASDRNLLMYESAAPLARLYGPFLRLDETFVLQEYFAPPSAFAAWMELARGVVLAPRDRVTLLNVTIRFVRRDADTALPYAQQDVFAFVLYWRIARTPAAEAELASVHRHLVDGTLRLGGTFYLPYRHHYDRAQLVAAYPMIDAFFAAKRRLDPEGRFTNAWHRAWGEPGPTAGPRPTPAEPSTPLPTPALRRADSFRVVQADPRQRERLARFLRHVFPIEDPRRIEAAIAQEVAAGHDDLEVFRGLARRQARRPLAGLFALRDQVRQVRELWRQNADLMRQIRATLALAGRRGPIRGLASIGDPGRLVVALKRLGVQGPYYVLHDRVRPLDPVERGSLWPVAERVALDYALVHDVPVPTDSVDLAICAMGLHHFPLDRLPAFLAIVRRIVRPGGLFLVREHDARPDLVPILDLAHAVFNAVTGVAEEDESAEIRAFRPIRDWRRVLEDAGFVDTGLLETDDLDPTEDHLLCFRVPAEDALPTDGGDIERAHAALARAGVELAHTEPEFSYFRLPEWLLVDVAQAFGAYMDTIPWYRFPFVRFVGLYWRILDAELRAAARARGPAIAGSMGAVMGLVIGIVATVQLLSMKLLAWPILALYGPDTPEEREQLLVRVPPAGLPDLGPAVRVTPAVDDLVLLEVPRHRPFTPLVRRLAEVDGLELIEASGQQGALQVRVVVDGADAEAAVLALPGVELVCAYVFPAGEPRRQLALAVPVRRLLPVVRAASALPGVEIGQVYDLGA